MTATGRIRRINSGSAGIIDAARCPVCGHPVRIHNAAGCVFGPCECVVARAALMPEAPRLEVPVGIEPTPAAPAAKPTSPSVAAAPASAVASAAPAGPVGESPAPRPVADLPPWLPGAGVPPAPLVVASSAEEADEIIAAVKAAVAAKRPRHTSARPAPACAPGLDAVVGERDAVEEVAAAPPAAATVHAAAADVRFGPMPPGVQATPAPLDLTPFLSASLHCYSAWYCARCYQRRLDPGACPECGRALAPVHVVVVPRETL